jgi:hypothetical protein
VTASSQDVISFKSKIPEFAGLLDADIAAALDEVDMWLDAAMWDPVDYPWARRFLAAHHLKLDQGFGAPGGAAGGGASTSTSDLFVRMVAFGERRVMFGERKVSTSEGAAFGAGEAMLEDTIYGQKFLRLRSRNFPGVFSV